MYLYFGWICAVFVNFTSTVFVWRVERVGNIGETLRRERDVVTRGSITVNWPFLASPKIFRLLTWVGFVEMG